MYQRILVALDLSEQTEHMLRQAKAMIDSCLADYRLVFVYEQPAFPWGEMAISMPAVDFDELKEGLSERLHEAVEQAGLGKDKVAVVDGFVAESILDSAKGFGADLIILGSHGVKGVQLLLGSTADKVLHHAPCDVLAVRVQ